MEGWFPACRAQGDRTLKSSTGLELEIRANIIWELFNPEDVNQLVGLPMDGVQLQGFILEVPLLGNGNLCKRS